MKAHEAEPFLEILVQTDAAGTVELRGELGTVRMIPFTGKAFGPLFRGIVEPCGVDTQVTNQIGAGRMSARYMLTGKDHTGASCRIYIENNGWFTEGDDPKPLRTVPSFCTDSKGLASFLHRNHFVGEITRDESGLWIRFYELTDGL